MKPISIILACAASCCLAARVETITLDLERPQQPFILTITEATDSTVSAQLRASGSEFDPAGWTGLLWYGGADGGQTLTNLIAGYGAMTWSVPVSAMPTNGRYSVQILGAISNRVEEWGRGALVVRINPSRDFLPAQWATNNLAYAAAIRAQAGVDALAAVAITNEQDLTAMAAIATNKTTVIYNPTNAYEWIDGAGHSWSVSNVTNYTITMSGDLATVYGFPPPFYTSAFPFSYTNGNEVWSGYVDNIGLYWLHYGSWSGGYEAMGASSWIANPTGSWPLTLPPNGGESGTAIINRYTTVTTRVDTVAWQSDMSGKLDITGGTATDLTVNGTLTLGGVSKSAWPSAYPTNYVAGFALPIPGTNMTYTLNVNSNGILEIWGVTP